MMPCYLDHRWHPQDTEAETQRWSSRPIGLKDKAFLAGHTRIDEHGLDLQWTLGGHL